MFDDPLYTTRTPNDTTLPKTDTCQVVGDETDRRDPHWEGYKVVDLNTGFPGPLRKLSKFYLGSFSATVTVEILNKKRK